MCNIGKPIEIIDVEPLSLPAPLRRETEQPAEQPVTVEVPVSETTVEPVHRREALTWRGEPVAAARCPTPVTAWTWRRCRTRTSSRSRLPCLELDCRGRHFPERRRCGLPRSRSKPRATTADDWRSMEASATHG